MSARWLPDVNIWLAACLPEHVYHRSVMQWMNGHADPIHFCRASQQGLLRLLTTTAVLAPYGIVPLSNRQALARMKDWLSEERIDLAEEPPRIEPDWERFADTHLPSPKIWMDAYLAAFAVVGGYRLVTTDKAFKQFKGLNALVLS